MLWMWAAIFSCTATMAAPAPSPTAGGEAAVGAPTTGAGVGAPQDAGLMATLQQRFEEEGRPVTWSSDLAAQPGRTHSPPPEWPAQTHLECLRTAVAAATCLASGAGLRHDPAAWVEAALAVSLPGRLSCYRDVRWKNGSRPWARVVLDGCHSPAAVRACATQLGRWKIADSTLVLGMARDKLAEPLRAPLSELCGRASKVICTAFDSPRAAAPAELAAFLEATGFRARQADGVEEALLEASQAPERPLVVAGSLYLLRNAFGLLELRMIFKPGRRTPDPVRDRVSAFEGIDPPYAEPF